MPLSGMKSLCGWTTALVCVALTPSSLRLCVRALAHRGYRLVSAGLEEAAHDPDHLVDRLGPVEHRLVLRDVVVGAAHLDEVERAVIHAPELLDLAVAREDARAIRPKLPVLFGNAELEREPEDPRKEDQVVLVAQPSRG